MPSNEMTPRGIEFRDKLQKFIETREDYGAVSSHINDLSLFDIRELIKLAVSSIDAVPLLHVRVRSRLRATLDVLKHHERSRIKNDVVRHS